MLTPLLASDVHLEGSWPPAPVEQLPRLGTLDARSDDDWLASSLDDDVTPVLAGLGRGASFALATLHASDGGPRPVGSQMVVTADRRWGFMSGGCVEGDIAVHARAALEDGQLRHLAYGRGSPFIDIRLPCGGRIDLLVEPIGPGDPAILRLVELTGRRRPARYLSDGVRRLCVEPGTVPSGSWIVDRTAVPQQRLLVVGSDPFAVAIAVAGVQQEWQVVLIATNPPAGRPPASLEILAAPAAAALAALAPDPWTAIAVATHGAEADEEALVPAVTSPAGYVGALGSRRRLAERRSRLAEAGVPAAAIDRLRAPIGLPIAARSPREIAVAVIAEIIAARAAEDP